MSKDFHVRLGRASKAHGLKGLFFIFLENKTGDSQIQVKSVIYRREKNTYIPYQVEKINLHATKPTMKLVGLDTRTEIESLLPFDFYMKRSDFASCEESEFYLQDLIGIKVYEKSSGNYLGVVAKFYAVAPEQDVAVIEKEGSAPLELPLLEQFFYSVDLDSGKALVVLPEFV